MESIQFEMSWAFKDQEKASLCLCAWQGKAEPDVTSLYLLEPHRVDGGIFGSDRYRLVESSSPNTDNDSPNHIFLQIYGHSGTGCTIGDAVEWTS